MLPVTVLPDRREQQLATHSATASTAHKSLRRQMGKRATPATSDDTSTVTSNTHTHKAILILHKHSAPLPWKHTLSHLSHHQTYIHAYNLPHRHTAKHHTHTHIHLHTRTRTPLANCTDCPTSLLPHVYFHKHTHTHTHTQKPGSITLVLDCTIPMAKNREDWNSDQNYQQHMKHEHTQSHSQLRELKKCNK